MDQWLASWPRRLLLLPRLFIGWFYDRSILVLFYVNISSNYHHPHQVLRIAIRPKWPSILAGPLDWIQCPHRADICKSLLIVQHLQVHMQESIKECCLLVGLCFSSSAQYVTLFIWFVRWEFSDSTTAALCDAASKICSKQHVVFLFSNHLTFYLHVSLAPGGASIQLYCLSHNGEERYKIYLHNNLKQVDIYLLGISIF